MLYVYIYYFFVVFVLPSLVNKALCVINCSPMECTINNMSYILHFLVPWTQNITLGLDPITLSSPQRIAPLLNVIFYQDAFQRRLLTLFLLHGHIMFLHSYLTCIVFDSPLFYHV